MTLPWFSRLAPVTVFAALLCLRGAWGAAAEVDVSAAEHVRPARPKIPARSFNVTDFDVRDADNPVFERVTRKIIPGIGPPKKTGEH